MSKKQDQLKPNLLIVDDEKNIRDMLSRHFRFLGYAVTTAADGNAALQYMAEHRFEVVISDISMPVMDGIDLLRQIKKDFPMVHCIMITGYVTMENILACMRLGADTCVFKPLEDLTELESAVSNAVAELKHWQEKMKNLLHMKPDDLKI